MSSSAGPSNEAYAAKYPLHHSNHTSSSYCYSPPPSSVYPLTPAGSKVLLRVSGDDFTAYDQLVVVASSLFFVGGVFWVPAVYAWLVNRYRRIPSHETKRRAIYASLLLTATAVLVAGPHRRAEFGRRINVRRWRLWKSWMRFFAMEVVADRFDTNNNNNTNSSVRDGLGNNNEPAILGISPHGIFPFGLAFAALTEASAEVFGPFRAVVATATQLLPWVRDVLRWVRAVDASRPSVERSLQQRDRIGLAPGGIAEISQTPSETKEFAIVRKGIFRLAYKYNVPIVPIYCFGSSMLLKRWNIPWLERLGVLLRISLVVFYGKWGLPIPFRQRLLYVMGNPIYPPTNNQPSGATTNGLGVDTDDASSKCVNDMYERYCNELRRIFDRHKESYAKGWEKKSLVILTE
ncbi:diacylglycerol acyltransferase [Nitzschia inconspicua]|uniref:Acyltransferase n=1 Tax=Nitzschia inconspicua TaxID=303405 RepID=A0A9K3PB58_9STRA|nr:diacylglycerol acyltransferase [Nitzschia inconspicua]